MTGAWRAMPVAVVRPAGFPLDLLDPLADARLPQLVDAVRESRAQLDRAAQDFEAVSRKAHRPQDADGVRAARAAYRAVQRRKPLPGALWFEDPVGGHTDAQAFAHWWTSTCTARDTALDELAGRYTAALGTAREHLGSVLRDPRLREALVLLTPEILDTTVAALLKRPPAAPPPTRTNARRSPSCSASPPSARPTRSPTPSPTPRSAPPPTGPARPPPARASSPSGRSRNSSTRHLNATHRTPWTGGPARPPECSPSSPRCAGPSPGRPRAARARCPRRLCARSTGATCCGRPNSSPPPPNRTRWPSCARPPNT